MRDYFYIEDQFEYKVLSDEEENDDELSEGGLKNKNIDVEIVKPPPSQKILIKQIVDTQPQMTTHSSSAIHLIPNQFHPSDHYSLAYHLELQ